MDYDAFKDIANKHLPSGIDFYIDLLKRIFKEPVRFVSPFSVIPAKLSIVRSVETSRVIRVGNIIEDVLTGMLEEMGFTNLDKNIGDDLVCDQLFKNSSGIVYLIEQKVRDDHDSAKKRGQIKNFKDKVERLRSGNQKVRAAMWFSDPSFKKNKKYYVQELSGIEDVFVFYGDELFTPDFIGHPCYYNELIEHFKHYREEQKDSYQGVEDLDISDEVALAIAEVCRYSEDALLKKLSDAKNQGILDELFPTRQSFHKALDIIRGGVRRC